MIYRDHYNTRVSFDQGVLLIDAVIGISLSFIFISLISYGSLHMTEQFDRAEARHEMMVDYMKNGAVSAYASTSLEYMYGNDRTRKYISLHTPYKSRTDSTVDFERISFDSNKNVDTYAGEPLCVHSFKGMATSTQLKFTPIILPEIRGTFTDLQVRNGIAYISVDSAVQADPDMYVIDIHDPAHANILSSLNTGPGIISFGIAQDHIYAVTPSTAGQLHVIKMNSLASLTLEKKYALPLPEASTTPTKGSSIAYHDGYVYIGTEKWDGAEFNVIDVSNVGAPTLVGSYEVGAKVLDISIDNDRAYLATAGTNQLTILDITNPRTPTVMSTLSPSGWSRQEGKSLDIFEKNITFGRTSGGFNIPSDHELFSISTTSSSSIDNAGGIYGIVRDADTIYAITHSLDREFISVRTTLATSSVVAYPLPIVPTALTCDADKMYVLAQSSTVIYAIYYP
jgi:hypothetical protein